MTTKRPWYPFYILDYRADTAHLNAAQHGAYRLLMDEYWLKGGLPDDEIQLSIICRLSLDEFRQNRKMLESFFSIGWKHKRIEKELQQTSVFSKRAKKAAAKRWELKAKQKNAKTMLDPMLNGCHFTLHNKGDSYLLDPTKLNHLPEQEIRAKPKPIKTRQAYPLDFEAFWTAYPTDANMPKTRTFKAWQALAEDDRKAAIAAIPAFKAYCAKTKDYRPVYAERYLSQRRFEGHLQTVAKPVCNGGVFVKRDTPQWDAWQEWWMKTKGKSMPGGDGWFCPSEWPPE